MEEKSIEEKSEGFVELKMEHLRYALAVILVLVLAYNFLALNELSSAVEERRELLENLSASPTPRPTPRYIPPVLAQVEMTELVDSSCAQCFNISVVSGQIRVSASGLGMNITNLRRVEVNSTEGRALLASYNITKVPTILLSKEARNASRLMQIWGEFGSVESDGTLVLRQVYPPYIDLTDGSLHGNVTMITLLDSSCSQCYDPSVHKLVLTSRFGLTIFQEEIADLNSTRGQELVAMYNITSVPTVILSPEMAEYPGMESVWVGQGLGTKESDGWYVFRAMSAIQNVIYRNVTSGEIVGLNESAATPTPTPAPTETPAGNGTNST